ncbi:MAG TPA: hypothetical protein VGP94_00175 [Tepidisphaeraceae bacterium]|nr:hypothetical protein [Tepidisphaeraceae bacterium]
MNDVDRLILEAWQKLGPNIMADPDELAKRLARRRLPILTRPVRAWCLALRASDTRITPEHAMDLDHPHHPYEPIEHEVTIQPHALRKYCRPVRTDSWGELVQDVAKQLGCSNSAILRARWAGVFTERFVKGLDGKHGPPIPLIHSWKTLDPSGGRFFERPEQLWGSMWEWLPDMLPDDFEQTVVRTPLFRRHPAGMRAAGADRLVRDPSNQYTDDYRLFGWLWLCPACKKTCRTIYCPLPPRTLFDYLGCDPAVNRGRVGRAPTKFLRHDAEAVITPPPAFACGECHKVQGTTRTSSQCWNLIVTTLTRGLLYGHEVPKPQWYEPRRKNARCRQLHRKAPRREAVLRRLLNGWTERRIARDLMMSLQQVHKNVRHLCKQEGVATRVELAAKLGSPHPQPLNQIQNARRRRRNIEKLLLQGLTNRQICVAEGLSLSEVKDEAHGIYRKHNLPPAAGRKALAQKSNIHLGGNYALNDQIRTRLLAGQTYRQIATEIGLSYSAVNKRCTRICHKEGVRGRKALLEKTRQSTPPELAAIAK